jgi:hypothetical protein
MICHPQHTPPSDQLERLGDMIASGAVRPLSVVPAPGDLIGFSGTSGLAAAINLATLGWPGIGLSHVGIVVQMHSGRLVVVESTAVATEPCLIHRHHVRGAQVHDLAEILERPGRIYHYPLRHPLSDGEALRLQDYLLDLVQAECPYDFVGAARARFTLAAIIWRWKHGKEALDSLFCSELCAAGLRYAGRFHSKNASAWSPNQLCRAGVRRGVFCPQQRLK